MNNSVNENSKVATMPEDFVVSVAGADIEAATVDYKVKPIDKIRVVLYKGGEVFDSFSFGTHPKSKLLGTIVALIGKVLTKRNERTQSK